ncbi:hypothetical protein D3C76_987270 [compost metagenome]
MSPNKTADTKEAKPVRPPAAIPAVDSAAATTGLVPNMPAKIFPTAKARRLPLKFCGRPMIVVCDATNPMFSNTTMSSIRNTAIQNTRFPIELQDSAANTSPYS